MPGVLFLSKVPHLTHASTSEVDISHFPRFRRRKLKHYMDKQLARGGCVVVDLVLTGHCRACGLIWLLTLDHSVPIEQL